MFKNGKEFQDVKGRALNQAQAIRSAGSFLYSCTGHIATKQAPLALGVCAQKMHKNPAGVNGNKGWEWGWRKTGKGRVAA